ncbi:MAG TPA: CDP-glucose 4,6-dehydratase [Casimicrobiaceae bacterium]|nr:CDP-glucose 4,6-dehydratase [Casimicrobiaceae bacterium]
MDEAFWAGKRVLITGHTGFKGGWLAIWLQRLGAEVFGFSLPPSTVPSLFELTCVGERMTSTLGDVTDLRSLQSAVNAARPQIVFHLAAQSVVRLSYDKPIETYATNVIGTVNLLECVRTCGSVQAVIVVTSDKCYDNREWVWGYRESDALGGRDPYSSSKACAELVTAAYRHSFFSTDGSGISISVATVRAGNVIGGGDWTKDRLIPDVMRSVAATQPVRVRHPTAIRPWQHVVEPLAGYLALARHLYEDGQEFAEAWNFGPAEGDTRPVSWIIERLAEEWGPGLRWTIDDGAQPHEANVLKLDGAKAAQRLGWRPRWDLTTALRMTARWYKAYLADEDMRTVTESQIDDYTRAAPGS